MEIEPLYNLSLCSFKFLHCFLQIMRLQPQILIFWSGHDQEDPTLTLSLMEKNLHPNKNSRA